MSGKDSKWQYIQQHRPISEQEVYELVGHMLFRLHDFEKCVRISFHLMHAVFSNYDNQFHASGFLWKMRKATSGHFFRDLRTVVSIDPTFDRMLFRLVRRRNQFAHKLTTRKEFNPSKNIRWHINVARFLFRLEADMNTAWDVFSGCAETLIEHVDKYPQQEVLKLKITELKFFKPL